MFSINCNFNYSHILDNDCPKGYKFQEGDAIGNTWAIEGPSGNFFNPFNSSLECGQLCATTDRCKAIEWSPSKLSCVLIKTRKSNGTKYEDYEFCSRKGMFTHG